MLMVLRLFVIKNEAYGNNFNGLYLGGLRRQNGNFEHSEQRFRD